MDEKVHLKENLAYARKLQGLRQYELAERIGVKPNTISNYEKGVSMPDFETLGKLRVALKVSADDLVYARPDAFQKLFAQKKGFAAAQIVPAVLPESNAPIEVKIESPVIASFPEKAKIYPKIVVGSGEELSVETAIKEVKCALLHPEADTLKTSEMPSAVSSFVSKAHRKKAFIEIGSIKFSSKKKA